MANDCLVLLFYYENKHSDFTKKSTLYFFNLNFIWSTIQSFTLDFIENIGDFDADLLFSLNHISNKISTTMLYMCV